MAIQRLTTTSPLFTMTIEHGVTRVATAITLQTARLLRTLIPTAAMVLVTSEVAASGNTICLARGLRGISAMGFPFFVFIGKGSPSLQLLSDVILMIL